MLSTLAAHAGPFGHVFWWIHPIATLLWVAVIVTVVVLVARAARRRGIAAMHSHWSGPGSAEATLAERFAQGDIDEIEYRARLEVLRASRPGPHS